MTSSCASNCPIRFSLADLLNKNSANTLIALEPQHLRATVDRCKTTRTTARSFDVVVPVVVTPATANSGEVVRHITASVKLTRRYYTLSYIITFATEGIDHVAIDTTRKRFDMPDANDETVQSYAAMAEEDAWVNSLVNTAAKHLYQLANEYPSVFESTLGITITSEANEAEVGVKMLTMLPKIGNVNILSLEGFGETYDEALRTTVMTTARMLSIKSRRPSAAPNPIEVAWKNFVETTAAKKADDDEKKLADTKLAELFKSAVASTNSTSDENPDACCRPPPLDEVTSTTDDF